MARTKGQPGMFIGLNDTRKAVQFGNEKVRFEAQRDRDRPPERTQGARERARRLRQQHKEKGNGT